MSGPAVLVGREAERARLDEVAQRALTGAGQVITVRGPAGTGKTSLLQALAASWPSACVTWARCVQTETELPYDALGELLEPLLDAAGGQPAGLPPRQLAALQGALALGPAVAADPLAVAAATAGILRAAASAEPLLVVVDDAQWLDPGSEACLAFATRRLRGHRALVVLALRDGEAVAPWLDELPSVHVGPLDADSSAALVRELAPAAAGSVLTAVTAAAAGNPLAMVEILGALDAEQQAGQRPLPDPLPSSGRLASVFERRIARLPPAEHAALTVCAAARTGAVVDLAEALRRQGLDPAVLLRLVDGRLLERDPAGHELRFVHPLVRTAAYHHATAEQRRQAHLALAEVLGEEERGWHLASAAIGPDETAAQALVTAAESARRRAAYATAARAMETAASLTADGRSRALRLVAAADLTIGGNLPAAHTLRLLESAQALGADGALARNIVYLSGLVRHRASSGLREVEQQLQREAHGAASGDPDMAASMLALASYCALVMADMRAARDHAEQAAAVLRPDAPVSARLPVLATLAAGATYTGDPDRALGALVEVQALTATAPPLVLALAVPLALQTMVALGMCREAGQLCEALVADSRESGAVTALPFLLATQADAAYRLGDWRTAEACADEAASLARETDQRSVVAMSGCILARLHATTGHTEEAEEGIAEILLSVASTGLGAMTIYATAARGVLQLGAGALSEAHATLTEVGRLVGEAGMVQPTMVPWRVDAIEAAARVGDTASAEAHLATLQHEASLFGSPLAHAWVQRGRMLLADDIDDVTSALTAALGHHDQAHDPFERARTLLAAGRLLHRAKRHREARPLLREAATEMERLGAEQWRAAAEAELRSAGGRSAASAPSAGVGELTERERRVAEAVAQGMTNKEVAAAEFLSVKTVEFHLARVYRKLGVRSRTQLVAALADRSAPSSG